MVFMRLAALMCGCFASSAVFAQVALTDSVPTITVIGHARAEVVPDFVTLSLGVVTEKPTATAAAAANAQAAQAVVQQLQDQGIDPSNIQTTEVSLTPLTTMCPMRSATPRVRSCAVIGRETGSESK